jgi:hypothetical protein
MSHCIFLTMYIYIYMQTTMLRALRLLGTVVAVMQPPCEPTSLRISRAEAMSIADDDEIIGLMLLRSQCSCCGKNCFATFRHSVADPTQTIIKLRKVRMAQGYTSGGRGEGPWLAKQLYKCRQYVGGRKPYKVNFAVANVRVCRFAWECLHGITPGSSRVSEYIASIRKGHDPSLAPADGRRGAKSSIRNARMSQWAGRHIMMMSECSPVGSEPRMFVPKMTNNDRHKLYMAETLTERSTVFGMQEQPLSLSHFNRKWKDVLDSPFLNTRTQQYYTLSYRTHLSRGFNECDTCTRYVYCIFQLYLVTR